MDPGFLAAQRVTGRVFEAKSGRPVEGGLITLIAENGDTVSTTLTSGTGTFTIRAPTD